MMIPKTLILTSALLFLSASPVPQRSATRPYSARNIESMLPPPSWLMNHAGEFGLTDADAASLRDDLLASRRDMKDLRARMLESKRRFDDALEAVPLDRRAVEVRFDELLEAESAVKRASLGVRLRIMESISADRRETLRRAAHEAADHRRQLRWKIEAIRRHGVRLREAGGDTSTIRARVRVIERLIREGRLDQALVRSELLLDELAD